MWPLLLHTFIILSWQSSFVDWMTANVWLYMISRVFTTKSRHIHFLSRRVLFNSAYLTKSRKTANPATDVCLCYRRPWGTSTPSTSLVKRRESLSSYILRYLYLHVKPFESIVMMNEKFDFEIRGLDAFFALPRDDAQHTRSWALEPCAHPACLILSELHTGSDAVIMIKWLGCDTTLLNTRSSLWLCPHLNSSHLLNTWI